MHVPEEVAVMALPNAILFPRALLPLYIFEPRYKAMLADCLAADRMFAVALLPKGWEQLGRNPAPHAVAGLGVIRTCVVRPDGTANLILEGVARVRIREYVRLRPYRVARAEQLSSSGTVAPAKREPLAAAVASLARARARLGVELPDSVLKSLLSIHSPEHFSDMVSHMLLDDYYEKQLMLETLDTEQRLQKLVRLLQSKAQQLQLWKKLQGKLPNENVGHN
jgi:Lon protease-like protein